MINNEHNLSDMNSSSKKFIRRDDLTPAIRLYIAATAYIARVNSTWGKITELANKFMISRMFIYILLNSLKETGSILYGYNQSIPAIIDQRLPYYYMLSLRLEGRCSIGSISTIMKRFGIKQSSVGAISQWLNYVGSLLPNTLVANDIIQFVIFVSDEIFSKSLPILVTVDPISSAILKTELADARKAEDWKKHWNCIENNGYHAIYLVSDEGSGLCAAKKEALADIIRQPDTYHAIAHQLGIWVKSLEDAAYKAINEEYHCWDKLDSARSDKVINKRIDAYEKAKKTTLEQIEHYEDFHYLYLCLIEELKLFDTLGMLRERCESEKNITTALDLIETLKIAKLTKVIDKIRKTIPDLLNYFDKAKSIVSELMMLASDKDTLQVLFLGWQWRKGSIKAKKSKVRKYCIIEENFYLELAKCYLQEDYDFIKVQVYMKLDRIVQSSAMVECINSIIRPYLNNSKNHVTQEILNLIMFYHNHRRYVDGKRKGYTPIEMLTGKKQEKDWIDLILDTIEQKDSSSFDNSR